jgi:hypothetical protein
LALSYVIWLFVFVFVSYGLGRLYAPLRRSSFFKTIFAPGFLILGALKLLACSISGAEVRSVKLFVRDGEAISYDPEDVSFLGKVILATFPLLGALLVFALIGWLFSYPLALEERLNLGEFPDTIMGSLHYFGSVTLKSLSAMLGATGAVFSEAGRGNILPIVYLYVLISILLAMPPRTRELRYAIVGIVVVSIVVWLILWAGISMSIRGSDVRISLWVVFSFALALLGYVTAVTLLAVITGRLIQALTTKEPPRGESTED